MKRIWLAAAACAGLLGAQGAAAVPLQEVNNRLFLTVNVNGQPVTALLDSAAEMTILDDDSARRLGLVQVGSATAHGSGEAAVQARFAEDVRIDGAGTRFTTRVGILDLDEVSQRLLGRRADMLLGRDLLDQGRFRIDIPGRAIDRVDSIPAGAVRLPVTEHRGVPAIPAAAEGHEPVEAVVDIGNGSEVLIGRAYAERIGLTAPERIVERRSGGGLGGALDRDIVVLRILNVGGREFRDVRAAIDPGETASDLNLGTSILRHFVITTDFPDRAIWLEPVE
ncbi:MAG: aspartyl protease family protein [Sphingosinicella sp.]|uniref:aspartyl protease family protein n=1 Tax=Sphingosinicella sp. TaxID=1917971 RepID=UPI00403832D2